MIITSRLHLIPATAELVRAEIADRTMFCHHLGASIPDNWPPETLADALQFFLKLLEENPSWHGWLVWYAVTSQPNAESVLIGSIGFKGPPDPNGSVEIGYSVLPQFQGKGYATEMVAGLIGWVRDSGQAQTIIAQTASNNASSRRVLAKSGFVVIGSGEETHSVLYQLSFLSQEV